MKPTTFHPDADTEVTEAAEYYERRSAGLGSELLDEVERALNQISINREASAQEAVVAFPLQSHLRSLPRSNSNRSVRSPEAAPILLAQAIEGC